MKGIKRAKMLKYMVGGGEVGEGLCKKPPLIKLDS
jgi:hypothetical protein